MGRLIFIVGGARSGKSAYAQQMATALSEERGQRVVYIATAEAGDEEMRERIERHRRARPSSWETLEAPQGVAALIDRMGNKWSVILIDCLTLLISNLLLEDDDGFAREEVILSEVGHLIQAARRAKADVIVVSNEVGMGIVPATRLGRLFGDIAGRANQLIASEADEVYMMVAGIPLKIKGEPTA